ncbi:hypothetical protein SESBI_16938 [Sesbania bispinosa]|nr:hypothetical protein SESBI_16938 [Sesbania bispinosa]
MILMVSMIVEQGWNKPVTIMEWWVSCGTVNPLPPTVMKQGISVMLATFSLVELLRGDLLWQREKGDLTNARTIELAMTVGIEGQGEPRGCYYLAFVF